MVAVSESVTSEDCRLWLPGDGRYDPRRVFQFRHSFHQHPLLRIERLQELAASLHRRGQGQVKFLPKGTSTASTFDTLTHDEQGKSIPEVFERIEEPGSWVALYRVESDPAYRDLVWQVLDSVSDEISGSDPGIYKAGAFIFISSAPSITPFHIDRENNFLMHIHGRKRFCIWHPTDRQAVTEPAVENFVAHYNLDAVRFEPHKLESCAFNGEMQPGDGVYMPSTSAHMTHTETVEETGDSETYSISMGVVFYTRAVRRAAYTYALNAFLRRRGITPAPPYQSPVRDLTKSMAGRALVHTRRMLRGSRLPPGF